MCDVARPGNADPLPTDVCMWASRLSRLLAALLLTARASSSRSVTCVYACDGEYCGHLQRCLPPGASPSAAVRTHAAHTPALRRR